VIIVTKVNIKFDQKEYRIEDDDIFVN